MNNELFRLHVLRSYQILDTPPESIFDDLTRLAAHVCGTPIAIITLVDEYRQWFKSEIGMPARETARSVAFCAYTIQQENPFIVEDATSDPRFIANPLVTNVPGIRFYAGIPLVSSAGPRIGSLAVIDRVPRQLSDEQITLLQALARQTMSQLELRRERLEHQLTVERLWAAQRIANVGSWELFIAEKTLIWSRQVYEIFGVAAEQFDGTFESFMAVVHPDDRAVVLAAQEQAVRGEAPFDFQHRIVRPDGEVRYVRERAHIMQREGWKGSLLVGTVQDVTEEYEADLERRLQQESLRAALETLSFHVNNSPLAMIEWDPDNRVIHWSPQAQDLFGWHEAEVLGRRPDEWPFVHPDDDAAVSHIMSELLDGSAQRNVSHNRNMACDGRVLHCEWYNSARQSDDGRIISIFSLVHDVTQRVEIERANHDLLMRQQASYAEAEGAKTRLAESEERFRLVAQATVDTIWDWNLLTDDVWWNSGIQTLFGYRLEQLEPNSIAWVSRIHPDDIAAVLESIHGVIDGASNDWTYRYRFRRSDGIYVDVVDRGFVIRDAHGRAVRMVGGMTDISERLDLEEQLRQAQRLEALGQLTGGVAHDFNNLLTVILGNSELMSEELETAPLLRTLAEMISIAAQRGAALTQRLLAFARQQALDPQPVDVNALVARMDDLLRRTLGEHISIELVCAADLQRALVDAAQLESALLNLCINARDAMQSGGRLRIETGHVVLDQEYAKQYADVAPGEYVLLTVADTGIGIAPEHLARVFEPFFTTKEKGKGTGLGLSMVYGFIKQSRGQIHISSEVGQGTRVMLYLPVANEVVAVPPPQDAANVSGNETILVVEDNELVRKYVQQQLERLGYRLLVAADGPAALAILHTDVAIALLFTDIVMPGGMSGRELAEAARALRPELRILYTSGYSDNTIIHNGRIDPGVYLLSKPYRSAELVRKVREALTSTATG